MDYEIEHRLLYVEQQYGNKYLRENQAHPDQDQLGFWGFAQFFFNFRASSETGNSHYEDVQFLKYTKFIK